MCARRPAFFAAMWKRAAPEMLSRSRIARAGKSNAAARGTSSSGTEEPSRKLKALRACSSTYALVIGAFDEPMVSGFAIDAIEGVVDETAVGHRDIPFV